MSKIVDHLNFTGQRVLITGGGKGIGRATVNAFVQLGAKVIVFEKDQDLLTQLSQELGSNVEGVHVDLADWEATKKATESVLPVHHLVNNAAYLQQAPFLDVHEHEIDSLYGVNFKGLFNVSQVVAKGMIRDGIKGTIVNISSITDTTYLKKFAVYASTKAAVTSLTKSMANELGQYGIRVNYVRPGLINTEFVCKLPPAEFQMLTDIFQPRSSLPCLIEPSDVANVVVFLSSGLSSMMTGTPLTIDSGLSSS